MKAEHFELLVEEPSTEAFLLAVLPGVLGDRATFVVHAHQGKHDLQKKLIPRLKGYATWLPETWRIVVLLDRDSEDCFELKKVLEEAAAAAGLRTKSQSSQSDWQLANRIAVEELEAWFFGEWSAVCLAFPKMSPTIPSHASYRHCDAVSGGTWEALERLLKARGYFGGGLRKIELARAIGAHFNHETCVSPSFRAFRQALIEAIA